MSVLRYSITVSFILLCLTMAGRDIVVLYDNDVHCAVDGYAAMAELKKQYSEENDVIVVSSGDYLQGGIIGASSKGSDIIRIMNSVGYDAVTLGNHEFDYGIDVMKQRVSELKATVVSCNFKFEGGRVFSGYTIINRGGRRVAFVGVCTPTSIQSSTPANFMDEGGRFVYDFSWNDIVWEVQDAVDKARGEGADYVIVLSHLGEEPDERGVTSEYVISKTTGIDMLADGHSHSTIERKMVRDKNGKEVILTQTGTKFGNIGLLVIHDNGKLENRLIRTETVEKNNDATARVIDEIRKNVNAKYGQRVGRTSVKLRIYDDNGERLVRSQECNMGDLATDAVRMLTGAEMAFMNGGSLRVDLDEGRIRYQDLHEVEPFGCKILMTRVTGEKILDILEGSVAFLPEESGTFLQVSGIRFKVNASIKSPAIFSSDGFITGYEGERRVSDVYVMQDGKWVKLEKGREYVIATTDYCLIKKGCHNIFAGCMVEKGSEGVLMTDIMAQYIKKNLRGKVGRQYRKQDNRIIIK